MRILNKLKAESWNIAFRTAKESTILTNRKDIFHVINNPLRYWAADPFVFEYGEKTYLFAELFDYFTNKGVIGCTELTESGITGWRIIIKEAWHLSYPYVFTHNGNVYLMPEMNDGNEVWLYRANNFPYDWEKNSVLVEKCRLVDSTLVEYDGGFLALSQDNHQNPVVFRLNGQLQFEGFGQYRGADGCFVRPGGRFISDGAKKIAVCQDCSSTYGGALIFFEVQFSKDKIELGSKLSTLGPKDVTLDKVVEKNGVHTYTATARFEVIDIKTRRLSLLNIIGRIIFHMRGKK